jgi:glycine hydroxymethyltransferase
MILAKEQYGAAIDKSLFPGIQGGPLVHVIAAKAVCFLQAATDDFRQYSRQVVLNAQALAQGLIDAGFRLVSGGTDTHLLLVDVFAKGVRGKDAETALERANITANKNVIPFDVNPPLNPSGIRLGSPALTTRGFREAEMRDVAALFAQVVENLHGGAIDDKILIEVRRKVGELTARFPLYAWKFATAAVR